MSGIRTAGPAVTVPISPTDLHLPGPRRAAYTRAAAAALERGTSVVGDWHTGPALRSVHGSELHLTWQTIRLNRTRGGAHT